MANKRSCAWAGDRASLIISWNLGWRSCALSIKLQSSLNNIRMPETRMANEAEDGRRWGGRERERERESWSRWTPVVGPSLTKEVSGPVNCVSSDTTQGKVYGSDIAETCRLKGTISVRDFQVSKPVTKMLYRNYSMEYE